MLQFCSLASGSSGNAQYIFTKKSGILVDAGLSGKYIEGAMSSVALDMGGIQALLVTHEHTDHMKGIGVLMRRYGLPLFVTEKTWHAMKEKLGKISTDDVVMIDKEQPFRIGDVDITPYSVQHDAVDPVAYTFRSGGKKMAIATDLGVYDERIVEQLSDADFLMLESNHDVEMLKVGPYPYYLKRRILSEVGHLSNEDAGNLMYEIFKQGKTKRFLLAHLSKENNFPELALETVRSIMSAEGLSEHEDYQLFMGHRDKASPIFTL